MFTDVREVDEVRQVAVLAEELAEGDRCPGVAASNWYGGRKTTTTSPLRFGWSESVPSTLRELLLLQEHSRDDFLARVGRVGQVLEARSMICVCATVPRSSPAAHRLMPPLDRAGEVDVDLDRAAGAARFGQCWS